MFSNIKRNILPYYINLGGCSNECKNAVIESDDWSSIRMASKEVYVKCLLFVFG